MWQDGGTYSTRHCLKKDHSVFEDLSFHVAGLTASFRPFAEHCLAEGGLKGQYLIGMASVYFALLENDDCIVKELVDQLNIPNGTMSGLLDRLEKENIIERRRCSVDRRARRIKLTGKGRAMEPAMREAHHRGNQVVESGLKDCEISELKRLLTIVRSQIDEDLQRGKSDPAG